MDNVPAIVITLVIVVAITAVVTAAITSRHGGTHKVRHVVSHQVEAPIHQYTVHKHSDTPVAVNGSSSNDWLLYYYIFTMNDRTYYYSSPTPVSNFSSVRFTESSGTTVAALPAVIQSDIKEAPEQDIQPEAAAEPTVQEVEMEVVGDTENPETFHDGTDANGDTVESAPSDSAGSTDSGSTGGDAGGGDAGGGGDGGGGGGGD